MVSLYVAAGGDIWPGEAQVKQMFAGHSLSQNVPI